MTNLYLSRVPEPEGSSRTTITWRLYANSIILYEIWLEPKVVPWKAYSKAVAFVIPGPALQSFVVDKFKRSWSVTLADLKTFVTALDIWNDGFEKDLKELGWLK